MSHLVNDVFIKYTAHIYIVSLTRLYFIKKTKLYQKKKKVLHAYTYPKKKKSITRISIKSLARLDPLACFSLTLVLSA